MNRIGKKYDTCSARAWREISALKAVVLAI
jgi:hypothetical protein